MLMWMLVVVVGLLQVEVLMSLMQSKMCCR